MGLVDTVTLHSNSYRLLQPPAFVNQYAAVPSLHFGWNLLIGIALFTQSSRLVPKAFGAIVPLMMASAIVLTANHYVFDAVAGAVVALAGLAVAYMLQRRRRLEP
jgi:membrane-associated phospholipid phosphatase